MHNGVTVNSLDRIQGDRRAARRYSVDLELQYKLVKEAPIAYSGKCCDMSSGGICFTSDQVLQEGSPVEVTIAWPFLLQNTCPLNLRIQGHVVRSDRQGTAVRTRTYEFRTAGDRSFAEPPPLRTKRVFMM